MQRVTLFSYINFPGVLTFLPAAEAMICYRCTVLPRQFVGEKDQPCSKFDGSERFYQDCPTSTFCMKRIIHYRLTNGTTVTTAERDCAFQKDVVQAYNWKERRWHPEERIDKEAYGEGCFKGEDRGTPNGPSEYCFCSSNYCNSSSSAKLCGSLVILAFLLMKLCR
ncbi:hypothetical protein TSAR_011085 [Trichomalopsis sarcophagae]|uniref:Uncharacterized protein n=1 Tax=Trichomalopsis sarcophagae TaxID=543379 RepID=A0A232F5X1_9HYME|nr:hypothetical protein TSAR_011085 [Trichomalopsis sarcophagae]